jgi:DNA-directed RNA polymerase specialized sigma24 family protein
MKGANMKTTINKILRDSKNHTTNQSIEFKEEQRRRYEMNPVELNKLLLRETNASSVYLFNKNLRKQTPIEDSEDKSKHRFCNEIEALKAYVRAKIFLSNVNGTLTQLEKQAQTHFNFSNRVQKDQITAKPKSRQSKEHGKSIKDIALMDMIDIGKCLDNMPEENLSLLIEFYILKKSAKEIAKDKNIGVDSLGGRISQSRRLLARVLYGLIPSDHDIAVSKKERQRRAFDAREELRIRREKASRFIARKMRENA